jgi:hypothetical protein
MKGKIASLLLLCLVAVSIFYGFSSIASSGHEIQSMDAAPSSPTTITENPCQNIKRSYPRLVPLGDPIDDPTPEKL